jgi:hypothetical protein
MMGGYDHTSPPAQTAVEESKPTPPPAATAGNTQSGRAYSEQTVAPRPSANLPKSDAPPVPGDVPTAEPSPAPKAPASAAPTQAARLTVISTPTHAAVTVNGRWRGRTPLTLDTLRFGNYNVRVVQPGFSASNEDVVLSARQPMRTLSVHLQPVSARGPSTPSSSTSARGSTPPSVRETGSSSYSGRIYVDSRPRGAKVLIDGKMMGTTPASIPDIPIGSHVVRLELEDHRAWTTSTQVSAGEQARVTGSLERIR